MNAPGRDPDALARIAVRLRSSLQRKVLEREIGTVRRVAEGRVVASLQDGFLGEVCSICDRVSRRSILAQVVAVDHGEVILAPLSSAHGLSMAAEVRGSGEPLTVAVGDGLIGRAIDALGRPLDGVPLTGPLTSRPVSAAAVDPLSRPVLRQVFVTGVRAIDLFNSMAVGQRTAIFGMPGAGKSTLLSMLARHASADVVVLAMIGERGREVREFLDRQMTAQVRSRTVAVVATADRPAIERVIAGQTAHAVAEHLRAQGRHVLLLFDSVTRFARALREVGLAAGEQVVRQGLTPSVYAELPRLVERAGLTQRGAITAFYTVLIENDGINDAIAEEITSLTDGHILLDAKLAQAGHHPAIDILKSQSRPMPLVAPRSMVAKAARLRDLQSKYLDIELLLQVGEYRAGNDPEYDRAIAARPRIAALVRQDAQVGIGFAEANSELDAAVDAIGS